MQTGRPAGKRIVSAAPKLEQLVGDLANRDGIPHVCLCVAALDGSASWSAARGTADASGRPMTPETPYFIASIDKLYNATVIHALAESGALSLDSKIADLLGGEKVARLHVFNGRDYTADITVQHLLAHASGLPDHLEDKRTSGKSFVDETIGSGSDHYLSRAESIRIVREEMKPHFPPQDLSSSKAKIRYSDTNYVLLMEIIEAVTGSTVQEVVTDRVFRPAGLRSTYYADLTSPLDPSPEPAALWAGQEVLEIPQLLKSMCSIYSTASDQVASLRYIYSGHCFANEETLGKMVGNWRRFGFPTDVASLRAPSWPIEYGLGAMRFAPPALFTGLKKQPSVVGHTGSTGTWLFVSPELGVLFAGAVDQITAGPVPFRTVIPGLIQAFSE